MRRSAQSGVAVITALLVVAVAASAAAFMLAQHSALLDQAGLVTARAQADLYAQAGFDWARGVLTQDARTAPAVDSLDEGWAQPIVGLPVERAVIGGRIVDEQGKFNLNNLVRNRQRSDADAKAFQRLLTSVGLSTELCEALIDWMTTDDPYYLSLPRPYRAANQPLLQVEELYRVRGFDAAAVAKLKPLVTALPVATTVNVNTAPVAVLAALLPELAPDLIRDRAPANGAKPFRSADEIRAWAKNAAGTSSLDVKSQYYSVRIQVAQDDILIASEAFLQRKPDTTTLLLWRRPLY